MPSTRVIRARHRPGSSRVAGSRRHRGSHCRITLATSRWPAAVDTTGSTVADVVPARERGRYTGVLGGVSAVSAIAGPLMGGSFTDVIGWWRWYFWINLPLGAAALVVAAVVLRLPPGTAQGRPRLDVWGITWSAVIAPPPEDCS